MEMKKMITLCAACLALAGAQAQQPDPNFYIYLCMGQSNMEGNAKIEEQDRQGVDERFQVMAAADYPQMGRTMGQWYTAVPPLCREDAGLTPADYFGRTMVRNLPKKCRVGIINVAIGGCHIETLMKDSMTTYAKRVPDWMVGKLAAYNNDPYARMLAMARLAQQQGVIKGILLHQGESNSGDARWPEKVRQLYNDLVADLGLDPAQVPLLAGETVNADCGGVCAGMNDIINRLPQTLPNSYVIPSAGCTCAADHLHFDAAGYRELGKRYAARMLQCMGRKMKKK